MKHQLKTWGGVKFAAIIAITVTAMIILSVPAMAAPKLSDAISSLITESITSPDERDIVLQKAEAANKAGVPEDIMDPVIERSLKNGVSAGGLVEMLQALTIARQKDLPPEPLAGKIMEGLAKNVGERPIIRAMEMVEERMEFSAGLAEGLGMRKEMREDLIIETAGAIAAGMDRDTLREIFRAMAGDQNRRPAPVQVMEMVKVASGYGVDSGKVGKYTAALIEDDSADENDIAKLLKDLSEGTYGGISDNEPDDIVEKHMENLSSPSENGADEVSGEVHTSDGHSDGGSGGDDGGSGDGGGDSE